MKKLFSKEAVIGIVTAISLFVLYLGVNHLKGINIFKPTNQYYVLMPNVSDLQNSSPVFVDGFKVGIVNSIQYEYENPLSHSIVVQISLDKSMKLQTGSYVELKSGLTSGAYLDMKLNHYVSTYCHPGDTIHGIADISLMEKISNEFMPQIENLLPRLDSILAGIQFIVNHPALTQSLEQIEMTTVHLQKSSKQLNLLLSNEVPVILNNLGKVSSDFTTVSENLKGMDLQGTLNTVDGALQNIDQMTKQLNNPDSSLGLLMKDRNLYDHLDSTALNASRLLLDIRERPKRYVHFSVF
ncbi:MAG: MlaD family protein [Candidatus Azobacteroides sp.]|nr:MlaD family protein [Candidatus Azobacteroides sp.]